MINRNHLLSSYFGKESIGFWLLFILTSVIYLVLTFRVSSEIPYLDDYEALLQFLISVETEPAWIKKMGFLFQQHNEHRIVIPRIIIWIQYLITGELNLRTTLFIGNLVLIGICYIFIRFFYSKSLWTLPLATILLLMNYVHFENYQWALSSLQNYGVLFLSLISMSCTSRNKFFLAVIFACLAGLTSAGGFLLFIAYTFYFLLNKKYNFSLFYFSLIIIAYLLFYGWGYQSVHQHPGLIYVLRSPLQLSQYYFSLLASFTAPFFRETPQYAIPLGILLWVINIYATVKFIAINRRSTWVLASLLMNLILISIAYTRFNFGVDQAFASRYIVYSTLYLLMSLSMLFQNKSGFVSAPNLIVGALFLLLSGYHAYSSKVKYHSYVVAVKTHLNNTLCAYQTGGKPTLSYIGNNDPQMILKEAERLRIVLFSANPCGKN